MVSDIFNTMRQMQREMDDVFERFFHDRTNAPLLTSNGSSTTPARTHSPLMDLVDKDDVIQASLDMPGVDKDDIEIEVDAHGVTVSAQRDYETESQEDGVYRMERRYSGFKRRIPLPETADAQNASASYDDGVLTISVPKREETADKKRITVE